MSDDEPVMDDGSAADDNPAVDDDSATDTFNPIVGDQRDVVTVAADCDHVSVAIDEPDEGVATVTLSRPDARNALDAQLRRELIAVCGALDDPDRDAGVRVVVLTGDDAGKAFVAGADVTELRDRNAPEQRRVSERPRVYETVAALRQPVIARINGHALGGGCELALACDVRIAHERARLGQPEIGLGIMPGGGATQRLPRLVGEGEAMKLALTGELIDAAAAAEKGLVEEAHPDDAFDDRIAELAGAMATKSPTALFRTKEAVRASARLPLDRGIDYEAELFVGLFDTADKAEGIAAFLEDREPEWSGE